jgi:hypothetical protein
MVPDLRVKDPEQAVEWADAKRKRMIIMPRAGEKEPANVTNQARTADKVED